MRQSDCRARIQSGARYASPCFAEKFQRQPHALLRLLDLQQVAGAFNEAVVVAALEAERLVGRPGRRRALEVRIAADQLDRPAELGSLRPQVERQRLRRRSRPRSPARRPIRSRRRPGELAQHRARHQLVLALDPVARRARLPVFLGQLFDRREPPPAVLRPFGQPVLEHLHRRIHRMAGRRHVRRIEQQQRIPAPADLDGVLHGGAARHRMENAGGRPLRQPRADLLHDAFEIAAELLVIVVRRLDRDVLAVVAEIEYQHVEFRQQMPPVRIVGIGGETVAVRHQEPHAVGIAVPAHPDARAVLERHFERHAGGGNFERHRRPPPAASCVAGHSLAIKVIGGVYGDRRRRGQRLIPGRNQGFVPSISR